MNIDNIRQVRRILDTIEVSGRENIIKLLACMNTLDAELKAEEIEKEE